jgi:hypothetical protein
MKRLFNKYSPVYLVLFFCSFLIISLSCNDHAREDDTGKEKTSTPAYKKPISNYQDTLEINARSAVFYHPDSIQLLQIKAGMDSIVFDGTMHEFFYQIRNAKSSMQKTWPEIKIIDAKNCRFLAFQKIEGQIEIIDLDENNDAYGLFIFNRTDSPQLVDMTNIETALSTYFSK